MQAKDISIADYNYDLPQENIAYYPLAERDASKLLIYRAGGIGEDIYKNIGDHLPEGTLLVFNNTKVVEARIVFQKATGGQIEIFCLEPPAEYGGISAAMLQTGKVRWKCLIGGASKWKPGQVLSKKIDGGAPGRVTGRGAETGRGAGIGAKAGIGAEADMAKKSGAGENIVLEARYLGKEDDAFLIELSWTPAELSFAELLHRAGLIPLPPYIRRAAEVSDSERYQTIYARYDGSVAAPTAGLHFTEFIFRSLEERNIQRAYLTLHVGAGTFLPVKAATLGEHHMHVEFIEVTRETIVELLDALKAGRPVVPVGTTSARTIESLYWLGAKTWRTPGLTPEELVVRQWDAYEGTEGGAADAYGGTENGGADAYEGAEDSGGDVYERTEDGGEEMETKTGQAALTAEGALSALLDWMDKRGSARLVTRTQLLITPGYHWKITRGLITNFHQPESTLLLLIASLIGPAWKRMYTYAKEHGFRFLSYGDGCLLWRADIQ